MRWEPLEGLHRGMTSPGCRVMGAGKEASTQVRRLLQSRGDTRDQGKDGEKMLDPGYV